MTDIRRTFPQTVEAGDLLIAIFHKEEVAGYTTGAIAPGDPADEHKCIFSYLQEPETLDTERAFIATEGAEFFRFDVPTIDADGTHWPPGAYKFRVQGEWTRDGVRRRLTIFRGLTAILRSGDEAVDQSAHAHSMTWIIREVIREKLQGSSDIIQYEIGGRSIQLMTIAELQMALSRYEQMALVVGGGRRHWDSGIGFPEG